MTDVENIRNKFGKIDGQKTLKIVSGLAAALILLTVASVYYIDSEEVVTRTHTQNISFTSIETSGNNKNVSVRTGNNLELGEMPNGSAQRRYLNISSPAFTLATVRSNGNASEFLNYDEKFVFNGKERFMVEVETEEPGRYEGDITIMFEAPKTRWAQEWLELKRKHYY